jgi:hypothetical protein
LTTTWCLCQTPPGRLQRKTAKGNKLKMIVHYVSIFATSEGERESEKWEEHTEKQL